MSESPPSPELARGAGPGWRLLLWVTLPLYALDQITKALVLDRIPPEDGYAILPFFNLIHTTNTGAAFSLLRGNNGFFMLLSFVALGVLAWLWRSGKLEGRILKPSAALLVAGVLGNFTDRILHGHVIDFLDFHFAGWHWPAFNVADSCICVAAGLFILASWRDK